MDMVVIITGGAHGIGLCLAKKLLRLGARVTILDINELDTSDLPIEGMKNLRFISCDVGNQEAVQEAIMGLEQAPNVLVNNAGIHNQGKRLDQLSTEEIKRIIDTNLMGVIWSTKAILPSMMKVRCGHIINVSSCLGLAGLNNMTDYCATKFGVYGFNEALRIELKVGGYTNIKTTIICPFLVQTGMFDGLRVAHPWITRPLSTEEVATNILDAILYKDTEEIWLPKRIKLLPLFRLFPCWIYDLTQKVPSYPLTMC